LLDTGEPSYRGIAKQFKMELRWLAREDFWHLVTEIWNKPIHGQNSVQRWNRKMGSLAKTPRGWAGHQHGLYKMQKQNCQSTITTLDTTAENMLLTGGEQE